ncbi:hypothetical protein GCM10022198_08610 [Klugiella xanthotipulae]|uniref:Uncharacterized protein n=1 Tax=Klugiella xanthotipulae TaxID=244735 RepID=A0A543I3S4_9MICO|nr:hypothetical protein [Klugiella xanthotipulae]TQM65225.1 hypothetical protein FB466_0015 [Klugiella xanthotipulae]
MSANTPKRGRGRPKGSSYHGHRITPVWKADFDQAAYAKALILLAIHLDETKQTRHKRRKQGNEHEGGEDHDETN